MKRFLSVLIVLGFVACGSDQAGTDEGNQQDVSGDVSANDVLSDVTGEDTGRDGVTGDSAGDSAGDASVDTAVDTEEDTVPVDVVEDATDVGPDTSLIEEYCPWPDLGKKEAADESGVDDTFGTSKTMLTGVDTQGYIGASGDIDWYNFCVAEDGYVTIHIDFTDSYDAYGINWMMFAAYTDSWLESNVSVASSQYNGTCFEQFPVNACLKTIDVKMSVRASQVRYKFYVQGFGDGDGFFPGYDSEHPYTVRVDFTPGDDLEAEQSVVEGSVDYGSADTWRTAAPITLTDGKAEISSYGWYWNDIDWYKVTLADPGWVRIVTEIPLSVDEEGYALFSSVGGLIRMGSKGPEEVEDDLSWNIPYNDNCTVNRGEIMVFGGADYYIRTFAAPGSETLPYNIKFEYGTGGVEDDQPFVDGSTVGAAEDYPDAYNLGDLTAGGTLTAKSYFWHYFDYDWYKFTVPAGAGQDATVTLDFTDVYNSNGWYACPDNQDGVQVWMYMFDENSTDFPGIAQGYEDDVPAQTMSYTVQEGMTYYILVMSRENWDQTNPYTITVGPAIL